MSVRVVKEGKLPEQQIYTGTCCRCGCEVEAAFSELSTSPNGWGYGCSCPTTGCGEFIPCQPKSEKERYVDTDKVKYTEQKRSLEKQVWPTGYKGWLYSTKIYSADDVQDPTADCMYYYVKPDRSRLLADEARKYLRGEL